MNALTGLTVALYREEVARARTMSAEDKLLAGARLFEQATRVMADGIRHRHPGCDEDEISAMLEMQLSRLRALDQL